eukprot:gene12208-16353_t
MFLFPVTTLLMIITDITAAYYASSNIDSNNSTSNLPAYELSALEDIYLSTDGPNWVVSPGSVAWNFDQASPNPCVQAWFALECIFNSSQNLYHISSIAFANAALHGTLPSSIGVFSELSNLGILYNYEKLNGSIPDTIGNLTKLVNISINYNVISGTLPSSIGNLILLKNLQITDNYHINGSIPDSFGNLVSIQYLYLNDNQLTGSIPNIFKKLSNLVDIRIDNNLLSGHFPDYFIYCLKLNYISLSVNKISGTIPYNLAQFINLANLYAHSNKLTGTIPASLGNMTNLQSVLLYGNDLNGSIPNSFGNLINLEYFQLYETSITGTIPNNFGNLINIKFLYLYSNKLRGTIPNSIGNMVNLEQLLLYNNDLTGTIPNAIQYMTQLQLLELNSNKLTGTIPSEIGENSPLLTNIFLYNNMLVGSIPKSFAMIRDLTELLLYNNRLSGSLEGVFSPVNQTSLTTVDISLNAITGSLPLEVFYIATLNAFVAVSNCFTGSIPPSICNGSSLATLGLDGLQSSPYCTSNRYPLLLGNSYIIRNPLIGTIPSCLFKLPELSTFHVSGNGLIGTLPTVADTSSNALIDISLSHNALHGTIPDWFQRREWYNLDLSFNRLSGTLDQNFSQQPSDSFISLSDNRLSGAIPNTVLHFLNVSVLGSNLFSCNYKQSDLPQHDLGSKNFHCGSNSFNIPLFLWSSGIISIIIFVILIFYNPAKIFQNIASSLDHMRKWWSVLRFDPLEESFTGMSQYIECELIFTLWCKLSLFVCLFVLILLIPVYTTLAFTYGTYTLQYAWLVSAAYKAGLNPTIILIILLIILMITFFYGIHILLSTHQSKSSYFLSRSTQKQPSVNHSEDKLTNQTSKLIYSLIIYVSAIVMNFVPVIGANIIFVYVALYRSSNLLIITQFLLALFKLTWNQICNPLIFQWTESKLSNTNNLKFETTSVKLGTALVNNIVIPCVIIMIISPSCFYYIFNQPDPIVLSYSYKICTLFFVQSTTCDIYTPFYQSQSYIPPFTYSYQCSSSFITYYASTFEYLCFTSMFGNPLLYFILCQLQPSDTSSITDEENRNDSEKSITLNRLTQWSRVIINIVSPIIIKPVQKQYGNSNDYKSTYDNRRPFVDPSHVLVTLLTFLGILMTFGVMFPPLAVAVTATILTHVIFYKLLVGRFLTNAFETPSEFVKFTSQVESMCKQVTSPLVLWRCTWLLITLSCWYYTLFLFDMLGDTEGFYGAYWVLIVLPFGVPFKIFHHPALVDHESSRSEGIISNNESETVRNSLVELTMSINE